MKDLVVLVVRPLTTITKLLGPDDARAVLADSLLTKQQRLVIDSRSRPAGCNKWNEHFQAASR